MENCKYFLKYAFIFMMVGVKRVDAVYKMWRVMYIVCVKASSPLLGSGG